MITRVIKSLMVCTNRKLENFTYGRIYKFINDPDMYDTGYNWSVNDKSIIVAAPKSSFITINQFKESLQKKKLINNLK